MKIWITGVSGMLGRDLRAEAERLGHVCLGTDLDVNITDAAAVGAWLDANPVNWLINCAAYTAVDKAESEEEKAKAVNATGPGILATETAKRNIAFIHVSTDYVLNGAPPAPLREDAPIDPQNAYGRTKALGEALVAKGNPRCWIVRTAWLYGIHGNNFVKTMLRLMSEKDNLTVVQDQWGSPTWTIDLARALLVIAGSASDPGIYHFSDEGRTSWHGFAMEIQRQALALGLLQRSIPVEPVPSSAYVTPAVRPSWSLLDKTKIRSHFPVQTPDWESSLASYLALEKAAHG